MLFNPIKAFVAVLAIGVTLGASGPLGSPQVMPPGISEDLQLCRNVAAVDFDAVLRDRTASWAVADIQLSPNSGHIQGAYVDETGFHMGELSVNITGDCQIVDVLSGEIKDKSWHFNWQEGNISGKGFTDPTGQDVPIQTGFYVMKIDRKKTDKTQFSSRHCIPKEWATLPLNAMNYFKLHDIFHDPPSEKDQVELHKSLGESNPLVVIAAWKILARSNLLSTDEITNALIHSAGIEQGVLTLELSKTARDEKESIAFINAAKKAIDGFGKPEDAKGIAVGAWGAGGPAPAKKFGQDLLLYIKSKPALVSGSSDASKYIQSILTVSAVDSKR